jgi:hypothetical protein
MGQRTFSCGHGGTDGTWSASVTDYPFPCRECLDRRIGEKINFVRYGTPPRSGHSYNYRDQHSEGGVSVYEMKDGEIDYTGWYFGMIDRPMYKGIGIIVGWGSDREPLVRIMEIKKAK